MPRLERFTFLCDENERRAIVLLASDLQRSQSDAIRFVVIEAARELERLDRLKIDDCNQQISNKTERGFIK